MSSRRTEKKERILYGEEGGVVKSAMKVMGTMEKERRELKRKEKTRKERERKRCVLMSIAEHHLYVHNEGSSFEK